MPLRNLTSNAKIVTPEKDLVTSGKPDLTIDDQKQRLPKKDTASRKYMNTSD